MFNHKRLITLSIATSMVIPSFSTMTSVLANEPFVELNDQEENISLETNSATSTVLTQKDFDTPNSKIFRTETVTENETSETRYFLKSGNYSLTSDVTVPFTIYTDSSANITLDLGDHTLTSIASASFYLVGQSTLIIKGNSEGTIQVNSSSDSPSNPTSQVFVAQSGTLKINNIKIKNDLSKYIVSGFYIDPQKDKDTTIEVEVENSSISDLYTGVMIASCWAKSPEAATIKLKNTNFDCIFSGIDQSYGGSITIEDSTIKGKQYGIHSGAGNLSISNSSIQSGPASDTDITHNIGINLNPSNYWATPFNVDIKNSFATGGTFGLVIDYNTLTRNFPIEFSINISNSTFKSKTEEYGFGYSAAESKYQKEDPIFQKNITRLENVTSPQALEAITYNPIETDIIPYTFVTSSTPSKNVEVNSSDLNLETVPGTTDVLTQKGQTDAETKLKEVAEKQTTQNGITIYSNKDNELKKKDSQPLSYVYDIKLTSPQFTNKDDNTYTFQALITAKLKISSIICLLIPLTPNTKTEASEVTQNLETFSMLEDEEITTKTFPLYVELSEVLNNPNNPSSGLNSTKIQTIFNKIKETHDLAQIEEPNLSDHTLDKAQLNTFEKIDLTQAFELKDIGEVIEINGSEKQVVSNASTGGGGSSKPKPKPQEPAQEPTTPVGTPTSMYRLYNRLTGEHLYTTNKAERDSLLTSDTWKDEGQGWTAPSVSDFPVYRLLNPNTGDHHYTTDKNEFETLPSYGWIAEGIAFFSADKDKEENVILHRVYNPNAQGAGSHHYTTDKNERDTLISQGWIDEGTAWAGLPTE